jgi:hypothetical protein
VKLAVVREIRGRRVVGGARRDLSWKLFEGHGFDFEASELLPRAFETLSVQNQMYIRSLQPCRFVDKNRILVEHRRISVGENIL